MTKAKELRQKNDAELVSKCHELKRELFLEKNFRLLDKEAKNTSKRLGLKRDIARAKTILRERELAEAGI